MSPVLELHYYLLRTHRGINRTQYFIHVQGRWAGVGDIEI